MLKINFIYVCERFSSDYLQIIKMIHHRTAFARLIPTYFMKVMRLPISSEKTNRLLA